MLSMGVRSPMTGFTPYSMPVKSLNLPANPNPAGPGINLSWESTPVRNNFLNCVVESLHPEFKLDSHAKLEQNLINERNTQIEFINEKGIKYPQYLYMKKENTIKTPREISRIAVENAMDQQFPGIIRDIRDTFITLGRRVGLENLGNSKINIGIISAKIDSNNCITVVLGEIIRREGRHNQPVFNRNSIVAKTSAIPGFHLGFRDAVIKGAERLMENKYLGVVR